MYMTDTGEDADILRDRSHYETDTESVSNISCNGFHLYLFDATSES